MLYDLYLIVALAFYCGFAWNAGLEKATPDSFQDMFAWAIYSAFWSITLIYLLVENYITNND